MRDRIDADLRRGVGGGPGDDAGCARPPQPDAYGNVEATDVVVGAEAAGRLLTFDVTEGADPRRAAVVGTIDPSDLTSQRDQLSADRGAGLSRVTEVGRQVEVLRAQERAATAQREGCQGPARRTGYAARDRPAELRPHQADVRTAGGNGAADGSGRTGSARPRAPGTGAGRADRRAGASDRGPAAAGRCRPGPAPDRQRPGRINRRAGRAGERAHSQESGHQSDRRHGARDLCEGRRVRADRASRSTRSRT